MKRKLGRELPEYWLSVAESEGTVSYHDAHETVYTGFHVGRTPSDDGVNMYNIFEVTVRRAAGDATKLLFP